VELLDLKKEFEKKEGSTKGASKWLVKKVPGTGENFFYNTGL